MKHVSSIDEFPDGEHYVALETQRTHIPGDERSRTSPGHGYPAHTVTSITMVVFDNVEEMKNWVRKKEENRRSCRDYIIVRMSKVNLKTRIEVDMSDIQGISSVGQSAGFIIRVGV